MDLETKVIKMRNKKMRVRSIVKSLEGTRLVIGWSTWTILATIVNILRENNLPFSKEEIRVAFKLIPTDDYDKKDKEPLIKQLNEDGRLKSVFTS